jgi:outer membrane receptor for ferrienterochelin and colicin
MRISDLEEYMGMAPANTPSNTPQTGMSPQQAAASAVQQQKQQKDAVASMIKQRDLLKKQLLDLESQIRAAQSNRVGPQ